MPDGGLTSLTIAIFLSSFLVFVTLAVLAAGAVGSERRRMRQRLQRAAGNQQAWMQERAEQQVTRSVRRQEDDRTPLDRIVAAITPGYARLNAKIVQSGMRLSTSSCVLGTYGLCAVITFFFFGILRLPLILALPIGLAAGLLMPYAFIRWRAHQRTEKFLGQLPEALDLMVRGLKSGLPIMESIQAVANDFDDPIRTQFQLVHNKTQLGASLEDALWSAAESLKIQEFNFFAISVSIQRETGGNLTESLTNLSRVLRRRHNMKLKVKALSSEARASAYILTSLPFIIAGVISAISPAYMAPLVQDPRGLIMIAMALVSIGLGIAVMVKMVRFEI